MIKQTKPPAVPLRFFRWYCHPDYQEDIEGDLIERFERKVKEKGIRAAKWGLFKDVIRLFRPGIIRSWKGGYRLNQYDMFKNYFKITWRSLLKQKLYSSINIGGLAVGLTCFMLIFLYVQHEFSYDLFYENADRIHRVYQKRTGGDYLGKGYSAVTPAILATTLAEEFPEVTHATTLRSTTALLGHDESHFWESGLVGDRHLFDVFPFPFITGNPKTALEKAESIVLTESLAKKIFGDENPIGQSLIYENGITYEITGVIENPPITSSFKLSFIASIQSNRQYIRDMKGERWDNNGFHTFFTLAERAHPFALQDKLLPLFKKYRGHDDTHPFEFTYFVQPLSELHLETKANHDIGLKGNPQYISLFSLIGVVVLLLACVNYMNLAVARSVKRAREVGLRKVAGAKRWQLMGQFIGESVLIAFLALLLALGLTHFSLPAFGNILERPIELNLIENVFLLPGLLLLVIIVGVLSGSYPAFFMSSLRPVQVLKGKIDGKLSGLKVQQWLIVGQYATSIILIISSLIIYRQFQFIQQKELGYDREHIVTVPVKGNKLRGHVDVLKNEWLSHPGIVSVTASTNLPTKITWRTTINDDEGSSKEDNLAIYEIYVDYDFLDVFGIDLTAERNFSPDLKTDLNEGYIINETAAKALGWTPEEAIGKQFTHDGTKTVIGVVNDFHMHTMHMAVEPLMIALTDQYIGYISVKVLPENLTTILTSLETSIKKYSPYPFEYKFLDDQFDQLYKADLRFGKIFGFFTVLSILIASMGLFGLAAFTAGQRTKEIGIRKVLGASVPGIVSILAIDFLKMVLFGFVFAIPVAWYVMSQWLQDFAYRITIEWWMFVLAGVFAMVIAVFTISSQSFKAAVSNPVDALKNE